MNSCLRFLVKTLAAAVIAANLTVRTFAAEADARRDRPVFNVKDYGAVCDGKADDTTAIQKAINAAEAAGGSVVEFPGGVCLLNSCHPSGHAWKFYNLIISSEVTLRGANGAKILQGPGGRHPLPQGATEVENTVLAFGLDYEVVRFQSTNYNGGFYPLNATTAGQASVALSHPSDASHFKAGDCVAIYKTTTGDVIPTELSRVASIDGDAGAVRLSDPLARSFPAPSIANVTRITTKNVGVENLIVQGPQPLAALETFGFKVKNNQFIIDTSVGGSNIMNLDLTTLRDFQFISNIFAAVGPRQPSLELPQRSSQYGLFDGNSFTVASAGFGEYAAHITFTNNHFRILGGPKVMVGIFLGGKDITFINNDVSGGNITAGSGWNVLLADFLAPAFYASYVGQIRIANNRFVCQADCNACLGIFAPDTSVTGNTIVIQGRAHGIRAEGPLPQALTIQSNTITTGSGDGMLIGTPATGGGGSIITGNTLSGFGAHGIHVHAHGAPNAGGIIISNNTITGFATLVSTD